MKTLSVNAELQKVIDDAAAGIMDPKRAEEACRRMDRDREELRKKVGVLNIAVDLIREVREEA